MMERQTALTPKQTAMAVMLGVMELRVRMGILSPEQAKRIARELYNEYCVDEAQGEVEVIA
jgi:hypothetical protein